MNPLFQATMGVGHAPAGIAPVGQHPVGQTPMGQNPMGQSGGMNGLMGRVQQLANMFQNPGQMIRQVFPDAPEDVRGDPNQLLQWMQSTGKVNPQVVQMARQIMGGR